MKKYLIVFCCIWASACGSSATSTEGSHEVEKLSAWEGVSGQGFSEAVGQEYKGPDGNFMGQWFLVGLFCVAAVLGSHFWFQRKYQRLLRDLVFMEEEAKAKEMERIRKAVGRDFQDKIGNKLASITFLSNLASHKLSEKPSEVQELLMRLAANSRSLYNTASELIRQEDTVPHHNLAHIFRHLSDFGHETFLDSSVIFKSEQKNTYDPDLVHLSVGWSRQVIMVFKEAIRQQLAFGDASELLLELVVDEAHFSVRLQEGRLQGGKQNGHHPLEKSQGISFVSPLQEEGGITLMTSEWPGTILKLEGDVTPIG